MLVAGLAVFTIVAPRPGQAETPGPRISVIDGDTIMVDGRIVQIAGIDAPELGQRCLQDRVQEPCGENAAFELKKLLTVEHHKVRCAPAADDMEGEVCHIGHVDIATILLESGYVVATADAEEAYRGLETTAKGVPLGLWQSEFLPPDEWRATEQLSIETSENCPIKAVTTDKGRQYFVPTDDEYDDIAVDETRGDRFYCSDEAARADDWRRPGQR
jgi:endonuclease YncB( thermonuclease family)